MISTLNFNSQLVIPTDALCGLYKISPNDPDVIPRLLVIYRTDIYYSTQIIEYKRGANLNLNFQMAEHALKDSFENEDSMLKKDKEDWYMYPAYIALNKLLINFAHSEKEGEIRIKVNFMPRSWQTLVLSGLPKGTRTVEMRKLAKLI